MVRGKCNFLLFLLGFFLVVVVFDGFAHTVVFGAFRMWGAVCLSYRAIIGLDAILKAFMVE